MKIREYNFLQKPPVDRQVWQSWQSEGEDVIHLDVSSIISEVSKVDDHARFINLCQMVC